MSEKQMLKGGEFLVKETLAEDVFIPEEFNEEQRMMAQSCREFTETQVLPQIDQLEKHDRVLLAKMIREAGQLGLLGISIPEEYEGFGQNFVTSMLTTEEMGKGFSFAVAFAAHTGIGTLPILYYGTESQKKKYIPKLASGEFIGAYCLTEADAGSDANSGKSKALLSPDGSFYSLTGVKIWITNGGVADLLIVFAKIDDDKNLSAFIVETNSPGLTIGPDEEKMGIKGSSTVQIYFEDVKVPAENLLGERNGGFKIALNILNLGRIKLSGATVGAGKAVIAHATAYANERKQFGQTISNFGAIQHKLAEMVIRNYASESLTYRASQNIDDTSQSYVQSGMDKGSASVEAMRQYAIEASIAKVYGSEVLDYIVDEGVQIYGGMGYSAETPVERAYRDSRINRIFEGTNEINRMVIVGELLKRAMKGEIDLMTPAMAVAKELMGIPDFGSTNTDYFEGKKKSITNFKKSILMVAGAAVQNFMEKFADEQEILLNLAEMITFTYAAESILLRIEKQKNSASQEKLLLLKDVADVYFSDVASIINKCGIDAVNAFAQADEKQAMLMGMKRFTKTENVNVIAARRRIAAEVISQGKYIF
ncbi:MAG: acyl-CoA dehydrogenase [Bacteroidetes bacterium HGW-Bacteroidetes-1]|jgi:alkylation response protein AidB-like acyl-CoA dehydrogenase|nr:MAG: acyl-CoA dehydrogenase [Bacteroidetes bacterium HGW-Bacteroidetes-1]